MNAEQRERFEREQAQGALPAPSYPELPTGRMEARRRHLLSEVDRQAGARSRRPAPRLRRRMVLVLGTALATGATVVVLGMGTGTSGGPGQVPPATAASVRLLERAALAADATPEEKARAGQYVYIKTVGHTSALSENRNGRMALLRESEDIEQWTSVDGSESTLQREEGKDSVLPGSEDGGNLNSPTYSFLSTLPTDPEALLKVIRDDAEKNHGAGSDSTTGPDQQSFVAIGDLLRSGAAGPELTAALYRAAALIPGVDVVPDAVDAAGRRGVAVARVHAGERKEWVLDKSTARFLGERTVLLEDSAWGEKGTVVSSAALVASGIVDDAGQTP
ncbi:CU044_5270 family protein [Streptomyces somaliensis]|uniref:CU044_5270 family protein n=1 Tax=Streptomyces somaliensis TaxID=78355 RepID=UPI0020CFE45F|nr:CU044_5270 family protein [Streptomyces somaliensis]MCP9945351.1 CU044_5270 family protein [Streptomyces somaliensis]MCP9961444.1 CU044_5270 family protein [Streptomyces somaliensis]